MTYDVYSIIEWNLLFSGTHARKMYGLERTNVFVLLDSLEKTLSQSIDRAFTRSKVVLLILLACAIDSMDE